MIPPVVMPVMTSEDQTELTLQDLEGMALANNPTLVQANAQFQGEQGAAYQAGLPFNPVIPLLNADDMDAAITLGTWYAEHYAPPPRFT